MASSQNPHSRSAVVSPGVASDSVEEGAVLSLDFSKLDAVFGVVPVAVQRADTLEVVLLAYTNEEALRETMRTRRLVLWSTSRGELWEKGASSGCMFELVEARVNCEQNSLLYLVRPASDAPAASGMCHTKNSAGLPRRGCFYRRIDPDSLRLSNVEP